MKYIYLLIFAFWADISFGQITWSKKNGPFGGQIDDIDIHPSTGTLYAIGSNNLAYRSTDDGSTWSDLRPAPLVSNFEIGNTNDIWIQSDGTVWLITYNNLYKSTDDGVNWVKVNTGSGSSNGGFDSGYKIFKNILTSTLYVIGYHSGDGKYTVFRSTNGGTTWTKGAQGHQYNQLVTASNGNVYAMDYSGMYKSTNDGVTFVAETTPADVVSGSVSLTAKSDGSQINVVTSASAIYSNSSPSFTGWVAMTETGIADPTTFGPDAVIRYTPDNSTLLLADNTNNKFYTKGAGNWTPQSATFPSADGDNAYQLIAKNSTNFYAGTYAEGVWKSFNSGVGWSEINTGINSMTQQSSMVVADNGNVIAGGARPFMSTDNGDTWDRPFVVANQYYRYTPFKAATGSPKPIVMLNDNGPSKKSINNGSSWSDIAQAPSGRFASPDGTKILAYDNSTMSYSSNQGTSWTAITLSGMPTGSISIYYVAMDNSTNPIVYTALYDYTSGVGVLKFYKITLNSPTPTTGAGVSISLATIGVSNIQNVLYYNNAIYVLGNNGSGTPVLAITTNGGTSWTTKSVPANTYNMYIDPTTGYIFLARNSNTGFNVYLSRDNGDSYTTTTITMPTDRVNMYDIELDPVTGYAYAGFENAPAYRSEKSVIIPVAPTSLAASGTSTNHITLKWVDNALNETDYVIEKQVGGSFVEVKTEGSAFNTGMTVYSEISGLDENTSYNFRVAAKNAAGLSPYATVTVATPAACASSIPDNHSWSGNVNGTTTLTDIGIISKGNGLYYITDVSNGADGQGSAQPMLFNENCNATYLQYDYPLFANGNGTWNSGTKTLVLKWTTEDTSPIAGTVTLIMNATDPAPAAPTAPGAVVVDASTIEVSWMSSLFATSFTVERSTSPTFVTVDQSFPVNYPAVTYKDNTSLVAGATYYYRIKAVNATGTSSPTATVSVVFNKPNFVLSGTPIETITGTNSAAALWGDFNNDGYEDLLFTRFIIQPGQMAIPLLYKNNGAGNFTIVSGASGIEPSQYLPATVADYDNDGKLDIFFTSSGTQNYLYKGNGDFTFTKQVTPMDVTVPNEFEEIELGTTWFDFNNDGLLDLMLSKQDNTVPIRYFVQSPAGTFTQQMTGDLANLMSSGGLMLWGDYDNDGKQDLFASENKNAIPNRLFKNNGDGTLTKVNGAPFDTDLGTRTFGAAWGDYNNDGFLDLFICSAQDGGSNLLYKNNGNGSFTKQTISPVTDANVGNINSYGATWADINNDTFLDLIVSNIGGENYLFINNNGTGFTKVLYEKLTDPKLNNFAVATADYNRDGFIDVAFSSVDPVGFESPAPATVYNLLFKNINNTGNWLELRLTGTQSNRSAVGARVTVVAGGKTLIREVQSTTSFISENSPVVHFGLGSASSITSVEIKWPSGVVQNVTGLQINTYNTVTENADPEPPVFTDVTKLPASMDKSDLKTITVSITDNKAVTSATMYVKTISGSSFTPITGTQTAAPDWNFTLTANTFDNTGIQYYFKAKDAAQNETTNPASGYYTMQVKYTGTAAKIPAALVGTGGTAAGWKVIAIPFELGGNNGVQSVFNELTAATPALSVKIDYRILTYTETPQPAWQDYPESFSTISRGAGYFINVKTPVDIFVGDPLVAPTETRSNLFKINLKAGWNMIGNPYLEPIDWSNVVTLNNLTGTATTFKKFANGVYSNATAIAAYEGGFVHADAAIQVSIPFNGQTSPGRTQEIAFGPDEWLVPIAVQQGEISNPFGGVGMHSTADLSFDALDDINGPHWIEFTEMNFKHPEHMVKNFARDVVPVLNEHVWEFTVDTNLPGVATLNWDNESHTINKDLYLYDESTQTPVNMKEVNSYSFDSNVSGKFKVYYGDDVLSKIKPARVMLGAAYPNPTSTIATVPFSIPERGAAMNVRLDVFDMTGKRVGTIANGSFMSGFYNGQWEPQEGLSTGLYFFRLVAGNEVFTGKIALKK